MSGLIKLFSALDLEIEENQTITKMHAGVKSVVMCGTKPIVLSNGNLKQFSLRDRSQNIVLNIQSNNKDCSFLFFEKQIHEALHSKINALIVNILKILETPEQYNTVKSQKLKKFFLKLVKDELVDFNNHYENSLLRKWEKINEIMSERALQDGLIRLNHKLDYLYLKDKELIKYHKHVLEQQYKDNSNIAFVYFSSYIAVEFPLYGILTVTKDKLLSIEFSKTELKLLKAIFQYIFKNIEKKNAYTLLDITLLKDKLDNDNSSVYFIEDFNEKMKPTLLLIETFNSLASHIDNVSNDIDSLAKLDKQFNLNLTRKEIRELKSCDEFIPNNFGSMDDVKAEIRRYPPRTIFEEFNKKLNQASTKANKNHSNSSKRNNFRTKSMSVIPIQSTTFSSFGKKTFENRSLILDSTDDSFKSKIPDKERKRHTYILAGSGSGKTSLIETLLYEDCQKTDQSTIIFDLMGKATHSVLKFVKEPKRVLIIDPYLHSAITPVINPFELEIRDELSIENRTQAIINAFDIALNLKDGWSVNMKAVLAPCVSTLLRKGNSDIYELQKFMNDSFNTDLVKLGKESPIRGHRSFFNQEFHNESYETTKRAISAKLQVFLNDPTFAALVTGISTINLKKEVNTAGKIIIFKLPSNQKLFARLIMEMIQDFMRERVNFAENEIVPTHIYLDEFQNYLTSTIEEVLSESRNYKFYVTFAHQSFVHLDRKMQGIVLSNSNIKIVGQCSYDDGKKMSKEMKADFETVQTLEQGEFVFKIGANDSIKWKNTDRFINDRAPHNTKQRTKHIKYQFAHYYVYKEDFSLIDGSENDVTELVPKHEEF